jgi:hypothetical protein
MSSRVSLRLMIMWGRYFLSLFFGLFFSILSLVVIADILLKPIIPLLFGHGWYVSDAFLLLLDSFFYVRNPLLISIPLVLTVLISFFTIISVNAPIREERKNIGNLGSNSSVVVLMIFVFLLLGLFVLVCYYMPLVTFPQCFLIICFVLEYYIFKLSVKRKVIRYKLKKLVKEYSWRIGMIVYLLCFYIILSLFYKGFVKYEEILLSLFLLGSASMCWFFIVDAMDESERILNWLGVRLKKEKKRSMKMLQNRIDALGLNCLLAIVGYFLFRFVDSPILRSNLSIILLLPFYIFIYELGSDILENIYRKINEREKEKPQVHHVYNWTSFIDLVYILSKISIIISLILSTRYIFEIVDIFFRILQPFRNIIALAIAIPLSARIFIVFFSPFFKGETLEIGSYMGKIREIGLLFTRLDTVAGEQVYIPSLQLIVNKVKRLSIRESKDITGRERGIEISFLMEMPIDRPWGFVTDKFAKVFCDENRKDLKEFLHSLEYDIHDDEFDYLFDRKKSHPVVLVEDFKAKKVVYKFSFRVRDKLYANIFRSYIMAKFKEEIVQFLGKD